MAYTALKFQLRSRNDTTALSVTFTRRVQTVPVLPSFLASYTDLLWIFHVLLISYDLGCHDNGKTRTQAIGMGPGSGPGCLF